MESFFILKVFCHRTVKAYEARQELEQREKLNGNKGERQSIKNWKDSEHYPWWCSGPHAHAYFKTKEEAKKYIAENPDWIAEGSYYTVLVLLEKGFGSQGAAISWPNEHEIWFQYQSPRPPKSRKYVEIKRPKWAMGTAF